MLKRLFVTGTDTDVGKTVVSRGLLQAFAAQGRSVAGYKPIAARCQETSEGIRNRDALVLQASSSLPLSYDEINPITCLDEVFHAHATQDIDYGLMSRGLQHLSAKADTVVVEGKEMQWDLGLRMPPMFMKSGGHWEGAGRASCKGKEACEATG